MPLPEGYLPRKGDVLTVHMEVKHAVDEGDADVFLTVPGADYQTVAVPLAEVASLKRRTWREGEQVHLKDAPRFFGEVVMQPDDIVLVRLAAEADQKGACGGYRLIHCNALAPGERKASAARNQPRSLPRR